MGRYYGRHQDRERMVTRGADPYAEEAATPEAAALRGKIGEAVTLMREAEAKKLLPQGSPLDRLAKVIENEAITQWRFAQLDTALKQSCDALERAAHKARDTETAMKLGQGSAELRRHILARGQPGM